MSAAPIYVVVCAYGAPQDYLREDGTRYGPIVMETDVEGATLEAAQKRAAELELGYGPARVGRVVFDDHHAFNERRDICTEGDCHYYGQKRPGSCACSKVTP